MNKQEMQKQALQNAVSSESIANYQTIIEGLVAKGIDVNDITPRVNVFTFNAWKALGRVVSKGQKGVQIVTFIPCEKKDEETGEIIGVMKKKVTTVFHVSQTEELKPAAH